MRVDLDKKRADEKLGTKEKVLCPNCRGERNHTVTASYCTIDSDDAITVWFDYDTLACDGCGAVSYRTQVSNSEDVGYEDQGYVPDMTFYPPRSLTMRDVKTFVRFPPKLHRIYRESVDAFNHEIFTLCAAGLRALVEGICKDRKILDGPVARIDKSTGQPKLDNNGNPTFDRKDNLQGKIEGMAEKGVLTKGHAKILHKYRFLGNDAVHDLQMPSAENLQAAFDILEHTITHVYELTKAAEQIGKKKKKK